ncbi:MAG: heparinase II/III family protein, partial [Mesorhizobium sp.]|nr:heparinase II/III family protein [Mesorhizobium sp.]
GRQHYIVNAGVDTYGAAEFRPLARVTAAHSTATVEDTSSARFSHSARVLDLIGTPLVGGPQRVESRRIDDAGRQGFVAGHDGYVRRFGILHERELTLSATGDRLAGRDRFLRADGSRVRDGGRDSIAIRFHVHPDTELLRDARDRLVLTAEAADAWLFTCDEATPEVEESIFFAGLGGPRRSRQIVLAFRAAELPEVHWRFERIGRSDE